MPWTVARQPHRKIRIRINCNMDGRLALSQAVLSCEACSIHASSVCLPEEICVSASSVAASMMKGRRQLLEGNQSKEMLVAKRRSGEDENHISLNSTDRSVISGNGCAGALWGAGIISPWLYFMSIGSMFCCHIEDYAFGSANVILAPHLSRKPG